jgi:hypothetical protein
MKRFAVECNSPDGGRSVYRECFGAGGARGRVLSEHDELMAALAACGGSPATDTNAGVPWIFDRRAGRIVGARRINALYRDCQPGRGAR